MQPETIILGILLIAVTLYAVLGGADFGAGVWEFNTALQATEKERAHIYRAVGPVWEANHVWLIFILVLLGTAFPPAFAALCRALWIPLLLALVGIVFRGVGYAFRSHAAGAVRHQTVWGAVFALASTATPFFLGASIGALSSGELAVTAEGNYTGDYLWGWLSPLAVFTAFFAVGLCAYLAAVYLTWEADQRGEHELVQLWRQRAIATGGWMGLLATGGLVFLALETSPLWEGFRLRAWPMIGVSVAAGLFSLWALVRRHFTAAFLGAPCTVATVIWGWGLAQYPLLVPPTLTLEAAKSPERVLWFLVYSVAAGSVFLVPALGYLFYLFKGQRPA